MQASGRERLTITLDSPTQQAEALRSGTQDVSVRLTPAPAAVTAHSGMPGQGTLVSGVELRDGVLYIRTSSPAFGFIATRPARDRLVLDVFADPLGARWQGSAAPSPNPVVVPPAAAAAQQAQPAQPAPSAQPEPQPSAAASAPPEVPAQTSPATAAPSTPAPQAAPAQPPARTETPQTPASPPTQTAPTPAAEPATPAASVTPAAPLAPPAAPAPATLPSAPARAVPPSVPQAPASVPAESIPPQPPASAAPQAPEKPVPPLPMGAVLNAGDDPAQPQPSIRAKLNPDGPEAWPPDMALSSDALAAEPRRDAPAPEDGRMPLQPLTQDSAPQALQPEPMPIEHTTRPPEPESEKPPHEEPPKIEPVYKDEAGNIVPPPPDIPALFKEMNDKLRAGTYADLPPLLETLKTADLKPEEREEVLYAAMTAAYENNRGKWAEHVEEIIQAANAAINFHPESERVPEALAILASVNLAAGNMADAQGYVHLLQRKYPTSPNVAASFLALGEKQMERQEYAEASMAFQTILQDYPESRTVKDAARLQTYSLYRQGHFARALTLLDFVDRRWPRVYLEDPLFLTVAADIQKREGRYEDALKTYWTQYNLNPTRPESAATLGYIAELYFRLNDAPSASKILEELIRAFPQSPEASAALLRLGENGIHDGNPSLDELFAMFNAPNPRLPGIYYQRILSEYPGAPEALPARLRGIAWQLWNKEYLPAMEAARSFMIEYEDKPESLRARDILLRGFARELGNDLAEENFARVLTLWERFPQVHDVYQPLEPDLRMALARAELNRGKEEAGLDLLRPFLDSAENTDYGLYAYQLFLNAYLGARNWNGVLALGEKVAGWKLPAEARDQLDYSMALAAENLGLQGRALALWQKLAPREDIPLYQRAYATYFMARDAERRQDLRAAYQYNLDALGMFTQLQDENSPYADAERIRESIAALMDVTEIAGRFAESLEWAAQYAAFVPAGSPDYAGLRFREARLHRKMGDMSRWRSLLQSIIDTEPDSVFGKMAASELRTQDVARDLTRFSGQ